MSDLDFVEEIYFGKLSIDYNELYSLKKLKRICVNIEKGEPDLDYSRFSELEILSIDWYAKFPDLTKNENLKELVIWKFKPKSKSFLELRLPPKLENLQITESNILNLEGLKLNNLKKFEGHYCNNLESVQGIKEISLNLDTFILDYCRKLTKYDDLKWGKQLEKIILGDCGNIPNLNWLKGLKKVNHFSFWNTLLVDGNIKPCLGIDYVSFKNAKHYNHNVEEFGKS